MIDVKTHRASAQEMRAMSMSVNTLHTLRSDGGVRVRSAIDLHRLLVVPTHNQLLFPLI